MLYIHTWVIKMRILFLLALCSAAVTAISSSSQRIVGGSLTTIDQYPETASVLVDRSFVLHHLCGGTIINNRSVLTAAHCTFFESIAGLRIRVGSSWAYSGGVVHNVNGNIIHPSYNTINGFHHDLAILRSTSTFTFNVNVRAAFLAGPSYFPADYQTVTAVGWGLTSHNGLRSEQLRRVELLVIDQITCQDFYAQAFVSITDHLCAGWPFGGRDQCNGDDGGPLYHNGVVVGVFSQNPICGAGVGDWGFRPGINTRVSEYINWIQSNA